MTRKGSLLRNILVLTVAVLCFGSFAQAQSGKPNVLVIWGDDIGVWKTPSSARSSGRAA